MASYLSKALKVYATYPNLVRFPTDFILANAEGLAAGSAVGYATRSLTAGIFAYWLTVGCRVSQKCYFRTEKLKAEIAKEEKRTKEIEAQTARVNALTHGLKQELGDPDTLN